MNNQSIEIQAPALKTHAKLQPIYWSVRRELWENRSIYIAPLIMACIIPIGTLIGMTHQLSQMRAALLDPAHRAAIDMPYDAAAFLIMVTVYLTGVFYSLDALYGERRDRSIHFWKSMPISDLTTVLAKASIPLVVLPLVAFVITVAVHVVILLQSFMILSGNGSDSVALLAQLHLLNKWIPLFYALVASALWYAPIFSWFLVISVWAKRTTFLWALLPPVSIFVIEKIAFNTSHFFDLVKYRLFGWYPETFNPPALGSAPASNPLVYLTPGKFLSTPGLWIGLAVAAVFVALAIRIRRYRGPL
jgi:ABC-2 type transport system permease protein